jgi:hypothetical protein
LKKFRYFGIFILSLLSLHVFLLNFASADTELFSDINIVIRNFLELKMSLNTLNINYLFLFIFIFNFYNNIYFKDYKVDIFKVVLAFILSISEIIFLSFSNCNSVCCIYSTPIQLYKAFSIFIGYFLLVYAILVRISNFGNIRLKKENKVIEILFDRYLFLLVGILFLVCWLPYIIGFYPGGGTGDTVDSIFQFFHMKESWTIDTINLVDNGVYINKHHSVLFTILLGIFLRVGNFFVSYNFGYFLYVLFQVILSIMVFSFMFYYMRKTKVNYGIILFSILFICFSPVVIKYSLTAIKDTLSAVFTLLYIIFLLQIVRDYKSIFNDNKRLFILVIVMLLVMMFRNVGIYTVILSFVFLIFLYKDKWKKIIKVFLIPLVIFIVYDSILLPSLGVSDGSIREGMNIPFMQLARVSKYHRDSFSKEDIKKINKVLDFEEMINYYDINITDEVKNLYKKDCTFKERKEFFGVWFKYFRKYPTMYISSIINSNYGYFYPIVNDSSSVDIVLDYRLISIKKMKFSSINSFTAFRLNFNVYNEIKFLSPFSLFLNYTFVIDWFLIFSVIYILKRREIKYLVPLVPLIIIFISCINSPINGSMRYVLSLLYSLPIILSIDYYIYTKRKVKKYK